MNQEQANRMEEMISTLITYLENFRSEIRDEVSTIKSQVSEMKKAIQQNESEIKEVKDSQLFMQEELRQMRQENNEHHSEIIARFEILEANQEHSWEKTVMHERDIAVMKKLDK